MSYVVRLLVTLAILVPYWMVRMPRDTVEIFVVALIAFGTGRIVAHLLVKKPGAPKPDISSAS